MENKLPKVFANKIEKQLNNNDQVFYSNKTEIKESKKKPTTELNINQKIGKIFGSSRYVYKADVDIILSNGKISKKIIGRNKSQLITIDNELINISDIVDIDFSEKGA